MATFDDDDDFADYIYMQPQTASAKAPEDADDYVFEDDSNDTYISKSVKKNSNTIDARTPPQSPSSNVASNDVYMTFEEAGLKAKERTACQQNENQRKVIHDSLSELSARVVMFNDDIHSALKFLEKPPIEVLPENHCVLLSNWREVASISTKLRQIFQTIFQKYSIDLKTDLNELIRCYRLILDAITKLLRDPTTIRILNKYASERYAQKRMYQQLVKRKQPSSPTALLVDNTRPMESLDDFIMKPEEFLMMIITELEDITSNARDNIVRAVIDVRSAAKTVLLQMRSLAKISENKELLYDLAKRVKFDPEKWPVPEIVVPDRYLLFEPSKLLLISKSPRDDTNRARSPFSYAAVLESPVCTVTLYLFNDILMIAYSTRKSDDVLVLSVAKRSEVEVLEPEVEDDWFSASLLRLRIKEDRKSIEVMLNTSEPAECRKWKEALTVYEGLKTVKSVFEETEVIAPPAPVLKLHRSNTVVASMEDQPPPPPPRRRGSDIVRNTPIANNKDEVDLGDPNKAEKQAFDKVWVDCMKEIADLRSHTPDKPCRRLLQETSKLKGSSLWSQLDSNEQNVQELMFEVLVTEMTYFHKLHILMWGLFNRSDFRDALSAIDFKSIVSYLPAVYEISCKMLNALAKCWQTDCGCKLLKPAFLRVIKQYVETKQFQQVYPIIITDQSYQISALEELLTQKSNVSRRSSINIVQDGAQPVTDIVTLRWLVQKFETSFPTPVVLRDLLLLPFNRLTKLQLLMKTISDKAKAGSETKALAGQIEDKLHSLLTLSNERKRTIENRARFITLCDDLDSKQPFVQLDITHFHKGHHSIVMQDSVTWARIDEVSKDRQFDKLFKKGPLMNVELILLDDSLMLNVRKKNDRLIVVEIASLDSVKFHSVDSSIDEKLDSLKKGYGDSASAKVSNQRRHSEVPVTDQSAVNRATKDSNVTFKLKIRTNEFTLQTSTQTKYNEWKNLLSKKRN